MHNIDILDLESLSVQYLCRKDKRFKKLVQMVGPIQYSLCADSNYSFLIHEIIEQMLSVKAGQKIYARFEELCSGEVNAARVSQLSIETIKEAGMSKSKARSILAVTSAIIDVTVDLDSFYKASDMEVVKQLTSIHGVGSWTAKMYLLFVLGRPDVLPYEDGAFLQTYRWLYKTTDCSPKAVEKKCQKWKPYSSIAARFFYRALDMGLTKKEFHLYKEETQ
jgi:DNA-3-methyladenine glycosylase II